MAEELVITVPKGIRGYPLSAMKSTDRPGYEYDPYDTPGEHAEILTVRGKVLWDGLWSCYYDIHISLDAIRAGWRTKQNEDVPDCPPLWAHKGHYWLLADLTYDLKRGSQGALIGGALTAIAALKTLGVF